MNNSDYQRACDRRTHKDQGDNPDWCGSVD